MADRNGGERQTMKTSPQQIEAFTYAARERSFSRAARVLGVTQSAITQHVGKLERSMGVQLFVRNRSGLELTQPAKELFALSDRMCTIEELISERLQSYGALSTGHVHVIANAPRPALPLIAAYRDYYPDINVQFGLYSWTVAMSMVRERAIDIAIITEPDQVDGMFSQELEQTRYMAYMRKEHPLSKRKSVSLRSLTDEPIIVPEAGSLTQRVVNERAASLGITFNKLMTMRTFPVVKEAVLHGIGVGILLDASFYPSRQLVLKPIKEINEVFRTYLVAPADKSDLRFVRSFIDIAAS